MRGGPALEKGSDVWGDRPTVAGRESTGTSARARARVGHVRDAVRAGAAVVGARRPRGRRWAPRVRARRAAGRVLFTCVMLYALALLSWALAAGAGADGPLASGSFVQQGEKLVPSAEQG